jgi:hypothetical protein
MRVRCVEVKDTGGNASRGEGEDAGTRWKGVVECWGDVGHLRGIEKEDVVLDVADDV